MIGQETSLCGLQQWRIGTMVSDTCPSTLLPRPQSQRRTCDRQRCQWPSIPGTSHQSENTESCIAHRNNISDVRLYESFVAMRELLQSDQPPHLSRPTVKSHQRECVTRHQFATNVFMTQESRRSFLAPMLRVNVSWYPESKECAESDSVCSR